VTRRDRDVPGRVIGVAIAMLMAGGVSECTAPPRDDSGTAFVTPAPPGGTGPAGSARSDGGAAATGDSEASAADVVFIAAMVEHHEQAVELAELAPGRAADPELEDLAGRIAVTQAAEAESMRGWLERRRSRDGVVAGHDHAEAMRGEISRSTIDRAAGLEGAAFDDLFIAAMVSHHRGAVEMAEARLAEAGDPAVARWARAIATSQSLEIDRLLEIEARLAEQ
jgi:uncharacterized protein (DUF305 family)